MLDFIKHWRQERLLRRLEHVERNKKIENIANIKTIGLIFHVGDENHWNLLYHFAKLMENDGKQIFMIGFHDAEPELDYIITHSNTILCKEKEDFDYWGLPKGDVSNKFVAQHYDILIDTTDEPNFFGQYLALKCDADLKICYASDNDIEDNGRVFDMMIRGEGSLDLREYLNHVVKYLKMIKKEA